MKIYLSLLFVILFSVRLFAQSGCTDPNASNFILNATQNDEPCLYLTTKANFSLKATLSSKIKESSGIVWTDGYLWSHNDGKNEAAIYKIDTATGNVIQTIHISNFYNTDWEDIAADSNHIYIGDFGNNEGYRKDLKIIKISKSLIGNQSDVILTATSINFSYPEQTNFTPDENTNLDCEALICVKDSLYIFSKNHGDFQTTLYKLPKTPGTAVAEKISTFNVNGKITGADISQTGNEILLLGYLTGHTNSFIWYLSQFKNYDFFSGKKHKIEIGIGKDWQTEGIAFSDTSNIWMSNEITNDVTQGLSKISKKLLLNGISVTDITKNVNHNIIIYPNPSGEGKICIETNQDLIKSIQIFDVYGREITDFQASGNCILSKNTGIYELKIFYNSGGYTIRKIIF